jgi:acyl carrier protein
MIEKVIALIEQEIGQMVTAETRLDALECDSLEFLDLLLSIERELGISNEKAQYFETVGDFAL